MATLRHKECAAEGGMGIFIRATTLAVCAALAPMVLAAERPDPIRISSAVAFGHSHDGWKSAGLSVRVGDEISLFAEGEVDMGLPRPLSPSMFLWLRIGEDGKAFNIASDEFTFVADRDGDLFMAVRPVGFYWEDERGSFPRGFQGVPDYPVSARAEAVVWRASAEDGLRSLARAGGDRYARGLRHLSFDPVLPSHFDYLWNLGSSLVFEEFRQGGRVGIRALPEISAGIVKRALDIPLTETTRIDFEWRYQNLPALGPETEARYHDYLSIAVEFDNGQDLSWLWSDHLAAGTSFRCPLPWWDQRETHIVLQHGQRGLGDWHSHSRPVAEDYAEAVGGSMPQRIVGVWFINAGLFGGPGGEAAFANVVLRDGRHRMEVFER